MAAKAVTAFARSCDGCSPITRSASSRRSAGNSPATSASSANLRGWLRSACPNTMNCSGSAICRARTTDAALRASRSMRESAKLMARSGVHTPLSTSARRSGRGSVLSHCRQGREHEGVAELQPERGYWESFGHRAVRGVFCVTPRQPEVSEVIGDVAARSFTGHIPPVTDTSVRVPSSVSQQRVELVQSACGREVTAQILQRVLRDRAGQIREVESGKVLAQPTPRTD